MPENADYYIKKLHLQSHVEGGAFNETYRSPLLFSQDSLSPAYAGNRNASTLIYFLLKHGQFSAFHKIASDEIWHFYEGNTLHIYEINKSGHLRIHKLGRNLEAGESYQVIIPGGSWFASRCEEPGGFSLCGCSVSPGFDFADFELADHATLSDLFPGYEALIRELTR